MTRSGVIILGLVYLCAIYAAYNVCERHYLGEDGETYRAWHISFPGYATSFYPEQNVDLSSWVGTQYEGLEVYDKAGNKDLEATAGMALKMMGVYSDDYKLKKDGNHTILHRPERKEEYFTFSGKYYRIGKGEKVDL